MFHEFLSNLVFVVGFLHYALPFSRYSIGLIHPLLTVTGSEIAHVRVVLKHGVLQLEEYTFGMAVAY